MYGIHHRLRHTQRRLGLSDGGLARRLSAHTGTRWHREVVRKYQKGLTTKVPAEYVRDFCLALDVSPAWLLTGEGDPRWSRAAERSDLGTARDLARYLSAMLDRA